MKNSFKYTIPPSGTWRVTLLFARSLKVSSLAFCNGGTVSRLKYSEVKKLKSTNWVNHKRPKKREVDLLNPVTTREGTDWFKITARAGKINDLSPPSHLFEQLMRKTKNHTKKVFVLCLAYEFIWEITHMLKINNDTLLSYFDLHVFELKVTSRICLTVEVKAESCDH